MSLSRTGPDFCFVNSCFVASVGVNTRPTFNFVPFGHFYHKEHAYNRPRGSRISISLGTCNRDLQSLQYCTAGFKGAINWTSIMVCYVYTP